MQAQETPVPPAPPAGEPAHQVITPAGPTDPRNVHAVRPGEQIVRNPDGSYSVKPAPAPKAPKNPPP